MEIGLNGTPVPADERYWKDLGVTWCKWAASIETADIDDRAKFEYAAGLGLRVCVDLRTSSEWMTLLSLRAHERLSAAGKLERAADGAEFGEQDRVIRANQAACNAEVLAIIQERVRAYVERHADWCRDWEWWGEWDCPVTSAGIFHILCYPQTLMAVYEAIKQMQPDARVWTGGNGMDLYDGWVVGLKQDGAFRSFDCLNWHPYPMTLRERPAIERKLEENYAGWREMLREHGKDQWYTSTEWGYPSIRNVSAQQREWLESNVVEGGITQLYPEEALAAYAGDLRMMERHDFQVVMVHNLRDSASRFWGEKCGLLTVPLPGLKGQLARAVWRDAEKKPTYKLVREWAHRGRAGKPAFS